MFFARFTALIECSLTALVAGITSMSFNKVINSVSSISCAADRLLAYVAPGDVGLLVREDDYLRKRCWPPFYYVCRLRNQTWRKKRARVQIIVVLDSI